MLIRVIESSWMNSFIHHHLRIQCLPLLRLFFNSGIAFLVFLRVMKNGFDTADVSGIAVISSILMLVDIQIRF